jgi:hypothetical protein
MRLKSPFFDIILSLVLLGIVILPTSVESNHAHMKS